MTDDQHSEAASVVIPFACVVCGEPFEWRAGVEPPSPFCAVCEERTRAHS